MLIEVARIEPPSGNRKVGKVTTVTGLDFEIWPDKLAALRVGARYNIEVAEREFRNKTYRKITKLLPVNGHSNGHGTINGTKAQIALAPPNPAHEAEWQFVRDLLAAGLSTSAVNFAAQDLRGAITMLRALWRDANQTSMRGEA
jgi:hypothetical protein